MDSTRKGFIKIGVAAVAGAAVAGSGAVGLLLGPSADKENLIRQLEQQASQLQQQLTGIQQQLSGAEKLTKDQASQLESLTGTRQQLEQQASQLQSQLTGVQQQLTGANQQLTTANQQVSTLEGQVSDLSLGTGFLMLNPKQQAIVEAVAETIIPTDENGPGAKEAGVIYFIDRQLAGDYGKNAAMYMGGPFVQLGLKGPITVDGITYTGGTPSAPATNGIGYQYRFHRREYWRRGLEFLEEYSNSVYGSDFETLAPDKRAEVLTDLWDNKPEPKWSHQRISE